MSWKLLLKSLNYMNLQSPIGFWHNCSKQHILGSKNLLILCEMRKNCHRNRRKLLLHLFMRTFVEFTLIIIEKKQCYKLHTKLYCLFLGPDFLRVWTKLLGVMSANVILNVQLLIHCLYSLHNWDRFDYSRTVHKLLIDFQKACDSLR